MAICISMVHIAILYRDIYDNMRIPNELRTAYLIIKRGYKVF